MLHLFPYMEHLTKNSSEMVKNKAIYLDSYCMNM